MYKLLSIFLLLIVFSQLDAEKREDRLVYNTPSDSLAFMVYYNDKALQEQDSASIKRLGFLSDSELSILKQLDEFCMYIQQFEVHTEITIKYKYNGDFDMDKSKELLRDLNYSIKSFDGPTAVLQGEEGDRRYGLFSLGTKYSTLKLFYPNSIINKELRGQYNEYIKQIVSSNYWENEHVYYKIDSLAKLDQVNVEPYLNNLIETSKNNLAEDKDIRVLAINKEVATNPIVLYVKADYLKDLPYIFDKAFSSKIAQSKDFDIYNMLWSYYEQYDEKWNGLSFDGKKLKLTDVATYKNKKDNIHKKLDRNLLKYLPTDSLSSFMTYNLDLKKVSDLLLNIDFIDDEQQLILSKLALLAVDDDILDIVSNGIISFKGEESYYGNRFNFRAAFYMANKDKGQKLLKILSHKSQYLFKVDENVYQFQNMGYELEDAHLIIKDNVWVIGTDSPNELQKENKNVTSTYPSLANKNLTQKGIFKGDILGRRSAIKVVNLETEMLNSKSVKTILEIELSLDEESNYKY